MKVFAVHTNRHTELLLLSAFWLVIPFDVSESRSFLPPPLLGSAVSLHSYLEDPLRNCKQEVLLLLLKILIDTMQLFL